MKFLNNLVDRIIEFEDSFDKKEREVTPPYETALLKLANTYHFKDRGIVVNPNSVEINETSTKVLYKVSGTHKLKKSERDLLETRLAIDNIDYNSTISFKPIVVVQKSRDIYAVEYVQEAKNV